MPERTALASPNQALPEIVARLAEVQKSNRGAPGYARWVNRRLGRLLAAVAFKRSMTPNQVTVISAIFTFTSIVVVALARPTVTVAILVTLGLAFGFALDAADGQLARLRGGGSAAGEWLDHVIDCIKCSALHLAVLICWYRFYEFGDSILLIPIVFALQSAVFFFAIILSEQLRRSAVHRGPEAQPHTGEAAPVLRSLVVLPADYGLLCLSFVLLSVPTLFVWVYGLLAVANVIFLLGALPRWYREMSALG